VQHSAADYIIPLPSGLTGQSSAPDLGFDVRDLLPPDPPPSKPHAIIPSRPLSTATSTTHSTIGPLTPVVTQSRSRGRSRYGRFPASNPPPPDEGPSEPEPESEFNPYNEINDDAPITATDLKDRTPTRKKLHALLGIPLPNPRKSIVTFSSRPNSPEPHLATTSRPSTPSRSRKSWLPQRLFHTPRLTTEDLPQSPPLSPSVAEPEVHFNLSTTNPVPSRLEASSSRSKIPLPPSPTKSQPPRATSSRTPKASMPASVAQSNSPSRIPQPASAPRPTPHNPPLSRPKSADPQASATTKTSVSRPKLPTLKGTHYPVPSRPISRSSRPSSKGNGRIITAAEGSRENGKAPEVQKRRLNEGTGSRFGRWSPKLFGRRDLSQEREREKELAVKSLPLGHRRGTTVAKTETSKETEKEREKRAGAQGAKRTKSPSGQMTASIVRTKHGSFDFENPAWGLGIAKMTSSRNHSENRNLPLPSASSRKGATPASSRPLTPQGSNGESGHSHSTTHTGKTGKSVDITGKGNEEVSRTALSPLGTGLAKSKDKTGRLVSISAHGHGSFAFEPPVPVLKTVNPKQADEGGVGFKRTGKGRSLDLGLGLAWAPSKVREEALLVPSFAGGNSVRDKKEERGKEAKSRVGNAVSETFRGVLGEDGFYVFKKCELLPKSNLAVCITFPPRRPTLRCTIDPI
jgi:hypothetical protein